MFTGAEYLPERVVLLGIRADRPETEYGWIEPAWLIGPGLRIYRAIAP